MTKYQYTEGQTYLSESTPITISRIPTGKYQIIGNKGYMSGYEMFTPSVGTQKVTLTIAPVYSFIYDKAQDYYPDKAITYAGACTDFTPMGSGNDNSWAEGNGTIFDAIEVGYLNGSTWVPQSKSTVLGSTVYNCFTRIPRIYQKVTINTALETSQLDLSLAPFPGSSLHPAFIIDGQPINHKYIGRYLAYNNSSKLESKSGKASTVSTTLANFRTYASNCGSRYALIKYFDWDLLGKLFMLGFRSFNGQTALGYGNVDNAKLNTGSTDGQHWNTGGGRTTAMSFLGIEDWWGNTQQFIDDFYGTGGTYYAGSNSVPTTDTANKVVIGTGMTTGDWYMQAMGGLNNFFLADQSSDMQDTYGARGICDQQYYDSGDNIGTIGGTWTDTVTAGPYMLKASWDASTSLNSVGTRLTYWD